jgi:CheY-like chemotaxis protein
MNEKPAKTILHVEDDHSIRMTVDYILQDEGYLVKAVSNGQEALDFLATHSSHIDLILLDVMMPVMDGFTFCVERLKNHIIAAIPTIIYSADEHNKVKAEAIGMPFISKPFNLDDFLESIETHVRK